jgi:hypothetical protein
MDIVNAIETAVSWIVKLPPPIIAALVAAVISAIVSSLIASRTLRANRRHHIENLISKMIDISIQYPYLEDDHFCSSWGTTDKTTTDAQRYDNYCCLVFNLLETLWKFCHGRENKIESFLYVREIARRHKSWWQSEGANIAGYNMHFQGYIDRILSGRLI